MTGRECFHCKQWVEQGEAHDCWTTTEAALTAHLSEDLREAWERVRETAGEFGDQRIYASHNSIMFSRKSCYFFVRPKKSFLELCLFLGRPLNAPQVRRSERSSKTKFYSIIHVRHRDEVEAPITDWLHEAYEFCADRPAGPPAGAARERTRSPARKAAAREPTIGRTRRSAPGARKSKRTARAKRPKRH
ncbi:MAG: DUF5655 domain-containing protein [Vicinamibacterales bacterium]